MHRRDLLDVRTAASQALGLLPPPLPPAYSLLRFGRRAMATVFEVLLPFDTPDAQAAADDALDLIDRLEAQLTVYRDNE